MTDNAYFENIIISSAAAVISALMVITFLSFFGSVVYNHPKYTYTKFP